MVCLCKLLHPVHAIPRGPILTHKRAMTQRYLALIGQLDAMNEDEW